MSFKDNIRTGPAVFGFWLLLGAFSANVLLFFCLSLGIIAYSSAFFAGMIGIAVFFWITAKLFPIFLGEGYFKAFIVVMLISSVIYGVVGERLAGSLVKKGGLKISQYNLETNKYLISSGNYVYRWDGKKLVSKMKLKQKREVFLLDENFSQGKGRGESSALVMFKNADGFFIEGLEYVVPVSILKEIKKVDSGKKSSNDLGANVKTLPPKSKKSSDMIVLSREELVRQDLFGDAPDKLRIFISSVKRGYILEFKKPFKISVEGGTDNFVALYADRKRVKIFPGNLIPAGTRFQVRGKNGLYLRFSSGDVKQTGYSQLALIKVN